MQVIAGRTFGALKIAIQSLKDLYSTPIPFLKPGELTPKCPYQQHYMQSPDIRQEFSYDEVQSDRNQLIFYGETVKGETPRKICIKFVRQYSPEAHNFCARKGHAPELIAYEHLPGGWNMVVMDVLQIHDGDQPPQHAGPYVPFSRIYPLDLQPMEKAVTALIHDLHAYGYVHGDLRNNNFFVQDDGQVLTTANFMLLDFDWAGPIHKACYPMHVNRVGIHRPHDARDGTEIKVEHDLEMLRYIFHPW